MVLELLTLLLSQPHITCIDETLPAPPAHPFDADTQLREVLFGKHLDVSLPEGWQGQRGWKAGHFKERNVSNLDAMYAATRADGFGAEVKRRVSASSALRQGVARRDGARPIFERDFRPTASGRTAGPPVSPTFRVETAGEVARVVGEDRGQNLQTSLKTSKPKNLNIKFF